MARVWFCGFETGDFLECGGSTAGTATVQSTQKRSGNFAARFDAAATTPYRESTIGFGKTTVYTRTWVYITGLPTANSGAVNDILGIANSADSGICALRLNTNGTLQVFASGAALGSGTAAIPTFTWTCVELKAVLAAGSGSFEVRIGGVVDQTYSGLSNAATADRIYFGGLGSGVFSGKTVYHDDIAVDDAAYCGIDSKVISRSPITGGTPTYNAYTKSSGTDAGALWDEQPFNATTFCTGASNGLAQTANIEVFSTTQTGHGNETIGSGDTIVAARGYLVGKTAATSSSGNLASIRRRVNGVNTDSAISLTTSDAYYATPIFTASVADLNLVEVGALHGNSTRVHTIEDVGLIVEYAPVAGANAVGSAAGTSAVAGIGAASTLASGTATGTGNAVSPNSAAVFAGAGSASGVGASGAAGQAVLGSVGSASGLGATNATGAASFAAAGNAAGTAATTADGRATTNAAGQAAGLGQASANTAGTATAAGNAAGLGTAFGSGGTLVLSPVYLDPALLGSNIVLSNANLTATQTASATGNARAIAHHSSGCFYYEFTADVIGNMQVGLCNEDMPTNETLGQDSLVSIGVDDGGGWIGAGGTTTAPSLIAGHVYGVAIDIDAGKAWCKDLTAAGDWNANASANPVTGVNGATFFIGAGLTEKLDGSGVAVTDGTGAAIVVGTG